MENKKRGRVKSLIITEELIIEIISRVPAKDLLRFTCVSKSWSSLIHTDPYFYSLQIERTALDQQFLLIQKVIKSASGRLSYHHYLIDLDLIEDESINLREIRNPFQDRDAHIIASCQGLLVLQQQFSKKMAVFNPATRKHHIVPPNPAGDAKVAFCGFGYDSAHDCYKLITEITRKFELTFELMIYDIKNDRWCQYHWKDRHQCSWLECSGMECVDGVQYWCLDTRISPAREINKVVCFVLAAEEFHVVETPDFGEVKYYPNMTSLDGRLCLVVKGLKVERYEVWMIDIECASISNKAYSWRWTKILSLSNPRAMLPPPSDIKDNLLMFPICFSACKTRILFDVGQRTLFWYDQEYHQFRKLNDDPVNSVYSSVRSFVPCLVGIGIF